jgi:hypothetical protein
MMNPQDIQTRNPTDQDRLSADTSKAKPIKETGFKGWFHRHFGSEPPQKHSPNFFISDVTEGGIGSHHHHQVYRPDKRH